MKETGTSSEAGKDWVQCSLFHLRPFLSKPNERFCFLPLTNKVTCRSKCPRGSVLWLEGNQLPCAGLSPEVLWVRLILPVPRAVCPPSLPACVPYGALWGNYSFPCQEGVSAWAVMGGSEGLCCKGRCWQGGEALLAILRESWSGERAN